MSSSGSQKVLSSQALAYDAEQKALRDSLLQTVSKHDKTTAAASADVDDGSDDEDILQVTHLDSSLDVPYYAM